MTETSVEFYVFYHDEQKLKSSLGGFTDERFKYVDLLRVPVPANLLIPNLTDAENRAVFSEYLGFFSIHPKSDMVGLFPYSIPLKFSYRWARESGEFPSLLPPIDFNAISQFHFHRSHLYAVELSNPVRDFPNEIEALHHNFRIGSSTISPLGPFKGSIVVSREAFFQFRDWFGEILDFYLKSFDWRMIVKSSEFSLSELADKSSSELHVGRFRLGLGAILERSVAYYFGQMFEDNKKVLLRNIVAQDGNSSGLADLVSAVKVENTVIVVFANSKYQRLLENWIIAVRRLGICNFFVVAMDERLHIWARKEEIPSYFHRSADNLGDIWRTRIYVLKQIVDLGVDCIHSDADAVWLRNPKRYLRRFGGADIVVSQGTVWPKDVFEKWGFVLCCGFFLIRSSEKMGKFLSLLLYDMSRTSDDQISLNQMIMNDNIIWRFRKKYLMIFNGKELLCDRMPLRGKGKHLSVVVLPQSLFQRVHSPGNSAYVKHIFSTKTRPGSLELLKECGCYFLDQDRDRTFLLPLEWLRQASRRLHAAVTGWLERS